MVRPNPNFKTDFFQSADVGGQPNSQAIDSHIKWLEQTLAVSQSQIRRGTTQLEQKIREQQITESKTQAFLQLPSRVKALSKYFAQQLLRLEMLQLAESIVRVKGQRTAAVTKIQPAFFSSQLN